MILIEPFLLMTLHFSQIGFTDALTFILNLHFYRPPHRAESGKNPDQNALLRPSDRPPSKKTVIYYSMGMSIVQ